MNDALTHELRYLFPAWLGSVLLPWPALLLWRSDDGLSVASGWFLSAPRVWLPIHSGAT